MAAHLLSAHPQAATTGAYYVDTSAVIPLAMHQEGTLRAGTREFSRHSDFAMFAKRASAAGVAIKTSVLVIEEFAAKTRNSLLGEAAKAEGFANWKQFRERDPSKARAALAGAHPIVMKTLQYAADALGNFGIAVEHPLPEGADGATEAGRKTRKAHRVLLMRYAEIDSMDALHIVFGRLIACDHYITFDNAWKTVAEIEVVGH